MKRLSVFAALLLAAVVLGGCASDVVINRPDWPALSANEVVVRPNLQQLLATHHPLKVVLRVPNANNNVTQSQSSQVSGTENAVLNSAYDDIEKRLFEAGFIVRDRALLSTLIQNQGLTSYKDIQSRIDTDLIIDISSLRFNDPGDWLVSKQYTGDDGNQATAYDMNTGQYYAMGQAVASVEAQFIIVATGDVGGIVRLQVPICREVSCQYDYSNDGMGDTAFTAVGNQSVSNQVNETITYLWANGNGPGTFSQAADLIAKKLVQVLQGAQPGTSGMVQPAGGGGELGVMVEDLTAVTAKQLGVPVEGGALVVKVLSGSPAAMAGIHPNDVILSFNGNRVDGAQNLMRDVLAQQVGNLAALQIQRGNKQLDVDLRLASRN